MESGSGLCSRCILANEALDAFWEVIVHHYPEATYGDMAPEQIIPFQLAAVDAIDAWINNNVPRRARNKRIVTEW